jgi:hypothetical protein
MRRFAVLTASAAVAVGGLWAAGPAQAQLVCPAQDSTACADVSADSSGAAATVSTSTALPGGAAGVYLSSSGSAGALAQGNTNNPPPGTGWVIVWVSPAGPSVSCGAGGDPTASGTCP